MELGGTSFLGPRDLPSYVMKPYLYINDKEDEKHYYDLDPQWPLELKEIYSTSILLCDPEESSRPSMLASDTAPENWIFRRLLVERQQLDLNEELFDVEQAMKKDPKNYQLWRHRQWIALKLGANAAIEELEFTKTLIHEDANNFLAWYHRQWVLQAFGGDWEQELAYCDTVLGEDTSNSFAWDQRYFIVTRYPTLGGMEAMRNKEVDYALQVIASEPWSECPWTYIQKLYVDDSQSLVSNRLVEDKCVCVLNGYINLIQGSKVGESNVDADAPLRYVFACANALNMGWHLIKLGLRPSDEWISVIGALTEYNTEFAKEVWSTVQLAGCDVSELVSGIRRAGMPENRESLSSICRAGMPENCESLSSIREARMSQNRNLFA